jgi:hypothetical protein
MIDAEHELPTTEFVPGQCGEVSRVYPAVWLVAWPIRLLAGIMSDLSSER